MFDTASQERFSITFSALSGNHTMLLHFDVSEGISSLFDITLTFTSDAPVAPKDIIETPVYLTIFGDTSDRIFHGIVYEFNQCGGKHPVWIYKARIGPEIKKLSQYKNNRIFQELNTPDIIKKVLSDKGMGSDRFEFRFKETYPRRTYSVQFNESDFDFISRLMEEEGIFYYFEHDTKNHRIIFGDSTACHAPIDGDHRLRFNASDGLVPLEEVVFSFSPHRFFHTGSFAFTDFNFKKPVMNLFVSDEKDPHTDVERYDYPGRYDEEKKGHYLNKVRLEGSQKKGYSASGNSTCHRFLPGGLFELTLHDDEKLNCDYLITEVRHHGSQPQGLQEKSSGGERATYTNQFSAILSTTLFRPEKKKWHSKVAGPQSANVTGPKGEEIYTDEYGRVRVKFHWDRDEKQNEKTSMWIRKAEQLAGGQYGTLNIPRINHEVLVGFFEGSPDHPLIKGALYNSESMPVHPLDDKKTQSAIKTNSTPNGDGFNEIRFEDLKNQEEVFIHGEKDLDIRVKNDSREWVGSDRHLIVKNDRLSQIKNDHHVTIGQDQKNHIKTNRNQKTDGDDTISVSNSHSLQIKGSADIHISKSSLSKVSGSALTKAKDIVLEAKTGITLKAGASFVTVDNSGVAVSAPGLKLNKGGSALSGSMGKKASAILPIAALIAKDANFGLKMPGEPTSDAPQHLPKDESKTTDWIEIKTVDENGENIPFKYYRVTLPDGKTLASGYTDENGVARINGVENGECKITFDESDELWD